MLDFYCYGKVSHEIYNASQNLKKNVFLQKSYIKYTKILEITSATAWR